MYQTDASDFQMKFVIFFEKYAHPQIVAKTITSIEHLVCRDIREKRPSLAPRLTNKVS